MKHKRQEIAKKLDLYLGRYQQPNVVPHGKTHCSSKSIPKQTAKTIYHEQNLPSSEDSITLDTPLPSIPINSTKVNTNANNVNTSILIQQQPRPIQQQQTPIQQQQTPIQQQQTPIQQTTNQTLVVPLNINENNGMRAEALNKFDVNRIRQIDLCSNNNRSINTNNNTNNNIDCTEILNLQKSVNSILARDIGKKFNIDDAKNIQINIDDYDFIGVKDSNYKLNDPLYVLIFRYQSKTSNDYYNIILVFTYYVENDCSIKYQMAVPAVVPDQVLDLCPSQQTLSNTLQQTLCSNNQSAKSHNTIQVPLCQQSLQNQNRIQTTLCQQSLQNQNTIQAISCQHSTQNAIQPSKSQNTIQVPSYQHSTQNTIQATSCQQPNQNQNTIQTTRSKNTIQATLCQQSTTQPTPYQQNIQNQNRLIRTPSLPEATICKQSNNRIQATQTMLPHNDKFEMPLNTRLQTMDKGVNNIRFLAMCNDEVQTNVLNNNINNNLCQINRVNNQTLTSNDTQMQNLSLNKCSSSINTQINRNVNEIIRPNQNNTSNTPNTILAICNPSARQMARDDENVNKNTLIMCNTQSGGIKDSTTSLCTTQNFGQQFICPSAEYIKSSVLSSYITDGTYNNISLSKLMMIYKSAIDEDNNISSPCLEYNGINLFCKITGNVNPNTVNQTFSFNLYETANTNTPICVYTMNIDPINNGNNMYTINESTISFKLL